MIYRALNNYFLVYKCFFEASILLHLTQGSVGIIAGAHGLTSTTLVSVALSNATTGAGPKNGSGQVHENNTVSVSTVGVTAAILREYWNQ